MRADVHCDANAVVRRALSGIDESHEDEDEEKKMQATDRRKRYDARTKAEFRRKEELTAFRLPDIGYSPGKS
jgi:hypothetical protein